MNGFAGRACACRSAGDSGRGWADLQCYSLFFKKEMELSLIGLQNAGKTSLVNVVATGAFHEDMIPTVGFNMRKVTKGAVTIKLWDLGGQVHRLLGARCLYGGASC